MKSKVESVVGESDATYTVRDSDLLRVLVALAGRIAFPPELLIHIVGPYANAYNLCSGELTLSAIARATGTDKSNLRKAMVRWEQAGALFRVGQQGRPLRLYTIPTQNEQAGAKSREATETPASQGTVNGDDNG